MSPEEALDPSVLDATLISQLADAAAERFMRADPGEPRGPMLGRLEGLCEALAILVGRPADELRTEALARARGGSE